MRGVLRILLIAGLALLAGGTQIAPHEPVAGWTHQGLDHPPAAVHATLLAHVRYLLQQRERPQSEAATATAFEPAPLAPATAAVVLAFFAFGTPKPWRPRRLGIAPLLGALRDAQFSVAPALAPPRASLSS